MYICCMDYIEQIQDIYEFSNGELSSGLGERFRKCRTALGLTQKEVASNSGVSVMTIVRFERGEAGAIRLDNFIALLRAIQRLDDLSGVLPEMPDSLYAKTRRK